MPLCEIYPAVKKNEEKITKINKWMEIGRQAVRWRDDKRGYPKSSFDLNV